MYEDLDDLDFNITDYEADDSGSFALLPEGEYNLYVAEAEMKITSKGTGKFLSCTMKVEDGEHAGAVFWQQYNLNNPSEKAQTIGRKQFRALLLAMGINGDPKSFGEIKHISFKADVKIKKGTDGYKDSNTIKKHLIPGEKTAGTTAPIAAGKKKTSTSSAADFMKKIQAEKAAQNSDG